MESRVLHVFYSLDRGGRESRTIDIYRRLDRSRFQFDFYVESGQEGFFSKEIRELGGRIYYPAMRGIKSLLPNFFSFSSFLRQHPEYKIIFAYNQWSGLYLKQAKKRGVPNRIAWAANAFEGATLKNTLRNFAKRSVNQYATHYFAVSRKAGTWLFGEAAMADGAVTVWPNAIDTMTYAFSDAVRTQVRRELNLGDSLTVIHVGNVRRQKNHPFLLDVFRRICKRQQNARLLLIGSDNFGTLKPLIRDKGLEGKVLYLGVRDDVPRLLQAGDVFVFPSFYEGFPGAVLEAEASGLQCLVSDSVTDEVELTKHICRLPLSKGPEYWAERVLVKQSVNREGAWMEIRDAGYDVEDLARRAERFFEGCCKS